MSGLKIGPVSLELSLSDVMYIAEGSFVTLKFTLISFILAVFLATAFTFLRMSQSKIANCFVTAYISVFRGTPVLLQLSIVYYGLPTIANININSFSAAIITFGLNSTAYMLEHIKSGINSIDKGQLEAAKALNISYFLTMRDIVLPQALRNIIPTLVNEFVNLLKETAIISVIGISDLMKRSQHVSAEHYIYFEPLFIAGICYYIMVVMFNNLAILLERKLKIS